MRISDWSSDVCSSDLFKVGENHYQPPYFRLMERLNLEGGSPAPRIIQPKPMSLQELGECGADHLIDIREPLAYASGHLPGSFNLPVGMIPAFAGWFIGEGESVALLASSQCDRKSGGVGKKGA